MLAAISCGVPAGGRRAGRLAAGKLDEAVGHIEFAVAGFDDGAHVGCRVEAQVGRELQVVAFAPDVEDGSDGGGVLIDDERDGAHRAAVLERGLDRDRHRALVGRPHRRGEGDEIAGGVDGPACRTRLRGFRPRRSRRRRAVRPRRRGRRRSRRASSGASIFPERFLVSFSSAGRSVCPIPGNSGNPASALIHATPSVRGSRGRGCGAGKCRELG